MPSKYFWGSENFKFEDMINGERNNWPMWAGSCTEESVQFGLVTSHAYTILSAYEINIDGETLKLIKLRNPWGKGEWKGD